MFRRVINPTFFLPLVLCINSINVLSSETKNYIDNVLEEKSNNPFVSYQEIEKTILNNEELKALVVQDLLSVEDQLKKGYRNHSYAGFMSLQDRLENEFSPVHKYYSVFKKAEAKFLKEDPMAREEVLRSEDLFTADEIFTAHSGVKVHPVGRFEDRQLPVPGPVTAKLLEVVENTLNFSDDRFRHFFQFL